MTTKVLKGLRNAFFGLTSLAIVNGIANAEDAKSASATSVYYHPSVQILGYSTLDKGKDSRLIGSGIQAIANLDMDISGADGKVTAVNIKNDYTGINQDYKLNDIKIANYQGFLNKLSIGVESRIKEKFLAGAGIEAMCNSAQVNVNGLNTPIDHSESALGLFLKAGYEHFFSQLRHKIKPYIEVTIMKQGSTKDSMNGATLNDSKIAGNDYKIGADCNIVSDMHSDEFKANLEYNHVGNNINGSNEKNSLELSLLKRISNKIQGILKAKHTVSSTDNGSSKTNVEQDQISLGAEYRF
jgi:hypothetical protein